MMKNLHHQMEALPNSESHVKILANAEAVSVYAKTAFADRLIDRKDLYEKGARIVACNNALNAWGTDTNSLPNS